MPEQQIETPIQNLLKMAKQGAEIPTPIFPEEVKIPEAKVLLTLEDTCSSCGSVHSHPNPFRLLRFEDAYQRPGFWASWYDDLPAEEIVRKGSVEVCGDCFS